MTGWMLRKMTLCFTKSNSEAQASMIDVAKTMARWRTGLPSCAFSDNPDGASYGIAPFPHLQEPNIRRSNGQVLRRLELPEDFQIRLASTAQQVNSLLKPLAERASNGDMSTLNIDAEWNKSRRVGVSTLQLIDHNEPSVGYLIRVRLLWPWICLVDFSFSFIPGLSDPESTDAY